MTSKIAWPLASPTTIERVSDEECRGGIVIRRGRLETPFGIAYAAATSGGVCCLVFPEDEQEFVAELSRRYPGARVVPGEVLPGSETRLHVRGTDFQLAVWRALLEIPAGETRSYGEIARRVGKPGAGRAVGRAVGANPVSLLIPCHRVTRSSGATGNYRWGSDLKREILAREGYPR
jgi:AraC family transcriptional regulator of adaptative response/methylated-DNA-[protein]-cysteine methyltransferase